LLNDTTPRTWAAVNRSHLLKVKKSSKLKNLDNKIIKKLYKKKNKKEINPFYSFSQFFYNKALLKPDLPTHPNRNSFQKEKN
jgi:hypothetical protein